LLEVLIHGSMPRAEIAQRLGLSRPTLSRITRVLVRDGLLVESGTELRSSTGRPSELLRVGGASRHFLGVKLTGDHLYAVVTDLRATQVAFMDAPLESREVDDVVGQIAETAARFRSEFPSLTAVGVALAGTIRKRPHPPVVLESAFLGWQDVSLVEKVAVATGLPTAIDNDVRALTAAEHWFGAGAGLHSMVVITVGMGVGCGLVIDGHLVEGSAGRAGRISHLLVTTGGPVCELGHRGCASSYLPTTAIVAALRTSAGVPTYEEALERARKGEPAAKRAFGDAGFALGMIIGTVSNLLDPQKIFLTGDGLPLYEVAQDRVWDGVLASYDDDPETIDLDVQPFDFSEWARSAAALAIRAVLSGDATVLPGRQGSA
jgi:predicted NBD/HSP70 family sugar kinase